jgi:spore coat polysaccharide biosynthesis protein SpsF
MGSTRLPGKVLRPIGNELLLGHVVGRLKILKILATTVIATSTLAQDDVIVRWCAKENTKCFRGSEEDVLDRYFQCATRFGFAHIVRLTADNPFTDVVELERLIELHLAYGNDYTHSFGQMPIGVGAEIFSIAALKRSHAEGKASNHREHVNEYIQARRELFQIGTLEIPADKIAPHLRLTVDTAEDYVRACNLVERAAGQWLTTEEAIALCLHSA